MISEKVINNVNVKPLVSVSNDTSKIKGYKLIPSLYNVTFLCAKRQSGKTSVLAEILSKTSNKHTTFYIFCPTHRVDASWTSLIDILESRGNQVNLYDSLMEGKVNLLSEIIQDLQAPVDLKQEKKEDDISLVKMKFTDEKALKKKEYKPKKESPLHIFVFDDISHELKNPAIASLCKMSRHIKSAVYISSQYIHDLQPQSIKQLSFVLCFKSFNREKLDHLYKLLDLSIDLDVFYNIYDYVFKNPSEKYNFLWIDVRDQRFRKCFNKEILIE